MVRCNDQKLLTIKELRLPFIPIGNDSIVLLVILPFGCPRVIPFHKRYCREVPCSKVQNNLHKRNMAEQLEPEKPLETPLVAVSRARLLLERRTQIRYYGSTEYRPRRRAG